MKRRVLIAEDEESIVASLQFLMGQCGFDTRVARDGDAALAALAQFSPDLVLLDIMLPGRSGFEICRFIRAEQALAGTRVLMLTAKGGGGDEARGLAAGADDYLTKPFQPEELHARIKALLRRAAGAAQDRVSCGPLELDLAAQAVKLNGAEVELTSYEYRLLEHLVRNRQRVVSKDELAAHLYPHDEERDSNVIEVLIGRLRRKLDPAGSLQPLETLRGRGYRFTLDDS